MKRYLYYIANRGNGFFLWMLLCFGLLACDNQSSVFPGLDWEFSSPESQGVSDNVLEEALEYLASHSYQEKNNGLVIIRYGRVIYAGDSINRKNNIHSCSKGFTSLVLGLLAEEGELRLEDKVSVFLPELEEKYALVTWRHFATMTSGYSAQGISRWDGENSDWSRTPYVPDNPHFAPGEFFEYWDEAQMMFGKGLTEILGGSMQAYLDQKIMKQIGVEDWEWGIEQHTESGIPINNGCTGVKISASQFARLGLLFLNEGRWGGKALISQDFVQMATSVQVPISVPVHPGERDGAKGSGSYGFNWWVNSDQGLSAMPNAPPRTAYLSGLNHNMCFIVPEWDMVIVRLGDDKNPDLPKHKVWDGFFKILGKGIKT
jgi:CubicO group peptidase (beta-lactamase class C family)